MSNQVTPAQIVATATAIVAAEGFINLTKAKVCERVGLPTGSYFALMGCSFTTLVDDLKKRKIPEGKAKATGKRAHPTLRKKWILDHAVELSAKEGYKSITKTSVAEAAGVSRALVTQYFGTMNQLQRAIVKAAIKGENLEVIAQALLAKDPAAKRLPLDVQEKAVSKLLHNR